MTSEEISIILNEHKEYFHTGETLDISFRIRQLKKIKQAIKKYEKEILEALKRDLHKSEFESYITEVVFVLKSAGYAIKHLRSWAKTKKAGTPFVLPGAKSYIYSEPYGTVLIIAPFNYPFQLIFEPLIGAVAAGNCAVLKPSEHMPASAAVINRLIKETFEEKYIRVVCGGKGTTSSLINLPFDYIFFTGSVPVGKIVMEAAAKNLIPVTLELGGKSPCIVDKAADLKTAAERIVWGKFLNAGQTCIAPDYLILHEDIKEDLLEHLKTVIKKFYGEKPSESPDYSRIVNEYQFGRLVEILKKDASKIICGGDYNMKDLYISPTLLDNADWQDAAMQDEIFGPVLPVMTFQDTDSLIKMIINRPKPLALYIFTDDKSLFKKINSSISFGGGCLNDTLSHIGSHFIPFGGVGSSGIGACHGKYSFDTFSHKKSILKRTTWFSVKFIYPPYKNKLNIIKKLLK